MEPYRASLGARGGRPLSSALDTDALDELAEELLDGLLVPRGAATAARQLLAEGRFDLVDLMLDGGRLPLEDARQLKNDLADARRGAAGRATRALHLLTRRAEQLDLARGWHEDDGMGLDSLMELATADESAFTELLAGWEAQAGKAERIRGDELRAELGRPRDGESPDRAARNLLEECLAAGSSGWPAHWWAATGHSSPPTPDPRDSPGCPDRYSCAGTRFRMYWSGTRTANWVLPNCTAGCRPSMTRRGGG